MQESKETRFSVSYHTKDLLKRDPLAVREICNWLETHAETKRDRANRRGSRRMMARLLAAKHILRALEETAAYKEVLERTEGKVADKLITVDLNDMVRQLEAARQRVLNRDPQHMVVDGTTSEIVTDSTALTVLESKTSK